MNLSEFTTVFKRLHRGLQTNRHHLAFFVAINLDNCLRLAQVMTPKLEVLFVDLIYYREAHQSSI
jgi:hypothetical protein